MAHAHVSLFHWHKNNSKRKIRTKELLKELGLQESEEKATAPSSQMVWLGIYFDTEAMTMHIPEAKLTEILEELTAWRRKTAASRHQIQSVLGKLFFASHCCPTLRLFVNRMLDTLRSAPETGQVRLSEEFQADVDWAIEFLPQYNGIAMITQEPTEDEPIWIDACLTGCGGAWGNWYYSCPFPQEITDRALPICQLEMINAVFAVECFAEKLQQKTIKMYCDNAAVVHVLTAGRSREPWLLNCARRLWMLTALHSIKLIVEHVAGEQNILADRLSRAHLSAGAQCQLQEVLTADSKEITISESTLNNIVKHLE